MKAYIKLKMDRRIDVEKHYISLGGFEVTLKDGITIPFDFLTQYDYIDPEDASVLIAEMADEDLHTFPDMLELFRRAQDIVSFSEFYVYTASEDTDYEEINPIKVLEFIIEDSSGVAYTLNSSEYVMAYLDECNIATLEFRQKLLDTVKF